MIPNGIDLAQLRRDAEGERAVTLRQASARVGFVGRLERIKGAEYFLLAAALLAADHPDVRFVVAGKGSREGELRALAAAWALPTVSSSSATWNPCRRCSLRSTSWSSPRFRRPRGSLRWKRSRWACPSSPRVWVACPRSSSMGRPGCSSPRGRSGDRPCGRPAAGRPRAGPHPCRCRRAPGRGTVRRRADGRRLPAPVPGARLPTPAAGSGRAAGTRPPERRAPRASRAPRCGRPR